MYDAVIIGAGVCGSCLAYDLSHYEGAFAVIEQEHDIANQITMANSAIIHAGYDPADGTLKAQLNVEGAKRYPSLAQEVYAHYKKIGAYVIATNEQQLAQLEVLKARAKQRGIAHQSLTGKEVKREEPHITDQVFAALSIPDTAIIEPWEMAVNLMESAVLNGVELMLDETVVDLIDHGDYIEVITSQGRYQSKRVINAAGLGAQKIAEYLEPAPFTLQIKRGQYYVVSKHCSDYASHVLYPMPDEHGKGVLCVPTIHGNTLLGPSAECIAEENNETTVEGLAYVKTRISQLLQEPPFHEVIRAFSGLRPCGNDGDFYIRESSTHPRMIHVACIDSPGLASAPAISAYVIRQFLNPHHTWVKKKRYQRRRPSVICAELSEEERNALIQQNAAFGHMICRCELISEGEILDAIHRPCGARSIKAVKKRVRPGMGKCQGGFCEVEVAKLLARELQIPLSQVLYDGKHSELGEEVK